MKFEFNENDAPELANLIDSNPDAVRVLEKMTEIYRFLTGNSDDAAARGYLNDELFKNNLSSLSKDQLLSLKSNIASILAFITKCMLTGTEDLFSPTESEGYYFVNESDNGSLLRILANEINMIDELFRIENK